MIPLGAPTIVRLTAPPIGDQGQLNSCVGWAVGYSAMGILSFPKYNCWNIAERSPNYVYNQIKLSNVCASIASGSHPTDGLNLVKNQGDCSWNLFPYIFGVTDCNTAITPVEVAEAAQNKAVNWTTLNNNDVSGIKQALSLGFPVVIGFNVYQSFYTNTGVWATNADNTGGNPAGHAICIIGYNDVTQMFLAQNQWGIGWGANGYVSIAYSVVQNGGLTEAHILYGALPTVGMSVSGPANICTTGNYTVANMATGSTVTWSVDNTSIATVSNTGVLTKGSSSGTITLTASVTVCGGTTPIVITQSVIVGSPNSLTGTYSTATSTLPLQTVNFVPIGNIYAQYQWPSVSNPVATLGSGSPSGTGFYAYPNMFSFNIASGQNITVNLTGNGTCGTVTATRTFIQSSSYSIVASPNPASGNINLSISEVQDTSTNTANNQSFVSTTSNTNGITKMYLYDANTGVLIKQWTYQEVKATNYNLNIVGVKAGDYILRMERNNKKASIKVLIK